MGGDERKASLLEMQLREQIESIQVKKMGKRIWNLQVSELVLWQFSFPHGWNQLLASWFV